MAQKGSGGLGGAGRGRRGWEGHAWLGESLRLAGPASALPRGPSDLHAAQVAFRARRFGDTERASPQPPYLHELPHGDGSVTWVEERAGRGPIGPFVPPPDGAERELGLGSSRRVLCRGAACAHVCGSVWVRPRRSACALTGPEARPGRRTEGRPCGPTRLVFRECGHCSHLRTSGRVRGRAWCL